MAKEDWVRVGLSTCGIAAGADKVFKFISKEVEKRGIEIKVSRCGCAGKCYAEPLVEVKSGKLPIVVYGGVDEKIALEIIEKHILGQKLIDGHVYGAREC